MHRRLHLTNRFTGLRQQWSNPFSPSTAAFTHLCQLQSLLVRTSPALPKAERAECCLQQQDRISPLPDEMLKSTSRKNRCYGTVRLSPSVFQQTKSTPGSVNCSNSSATLHAWQHQSWPHVSFLFPSARTESGNNQL